MSFVKKDIDLREEFKELQKDFAKDILYVRASKYIRCTCFNELHQVGSPTCPKCNGVGKLTTIQKYNTIGHIVKAGSKANAMKNSEIGLYYAPTYVFYFNYKDSPRIRDRIFITDFNNLGEPVNITAVCEITSIDMISGDNNRNELITVYSKVRPELLRDSLKFISNLTSKDKSNLVGRKMILWPLVK